MIVSVWFGLIFSILFRGYNSDVAFRKNWLQHENSEALLVFIAVWMQKVMRPETTMLANSWRLILFTSDWLNEMLAGQHSLILLAPVGLKVYRFTLKVWGNMNVSFNYRKLDAITSSGKQSVFPKCWTTPLQQEAETENGFKNFKIVVIFPQSPMQCALQLPHRSSYKMATKKMFKKCKEPAAWTPADVQVGSFVSLVMVSSC